MNLLSGIVGACFHVTTDDGSVYGVAADGRHEARLMLNERLRREGVAATVVKVERVAPSWPEAPYGTVLCYTGPVDA